MSVKHLRDGGSSRMAKLQKIGAYGSLKAANKGAQAPRKYAAGGAVDDMGPIDGMPAKANLARPSRSKSGKGKKGGTNVNVIVMPKGGDAPKPSPGDMAMMGAGPGPMPPPPMPMPPPGAGGPPMRKHGGKVAAFKKGGRVHDPKEPDEDDKPASKRKPQFDPAEPDADDKARVKRAGGGKAKC